MLTARIGNVIVRIEFISAAIERSTGARSLTLIGLFLIHGLTKMLMIAIVMIGTHRMRIVESSRTAGSQE